MEKRPTPQDESRRLDCAIVSFYFPPAVGGIEFHLERLAAALGATISVAVLTAERPGALERDRAAPFEVIRRRWMAGLIQRRERLFKPLYPLVSLLVFFSTLRALRRLETADEDRPERPPTTPPDERDAAR